MTFSVKTSTVAILIFLHFQSLSAESPGLSQRMGGRQGDQVVFAPSGPHVLFEALDPAVKKWYVPQELFAEFQWRQWEYTNYARQPYLPYQGPAEGLHFYDVFGQEFAQGFLTFDWTQSGPGVLGSKVLKTGLFFDNLVIASDEKGQYQVRTMVGAEIRTTLTPLTFSKARFNGIQADLATDRCQATIIASRPSGFNAVTGLGTEPNERSNVTNLLGGRFIAQAGDQVRIGATYVNAFNLQTRSRAFRGNPFKGSLTQAQNVDITQIRIRLGDDSPDTPEGMAFFSEEMIVTTADGKRFSNRRPLRNSDGSESPALDYAPRIEGGAQQEGFRVARGNETIVLTYDLGSPEYRATLGPAAGDIEQIAFRLQVANDYRIDITSNNQLNDIGQFVYLSEGIPERTVRAPGNVRDFSNQGFVEVEYGLPTANEVFGFTLDVHNAAGFDLQAEFDRNRQHQRFPRFAQSDPTRHAHRARSTDAWMVNLSKRPYPFFVYGEAYSMDPDYSTSAYIAMQETDAGPIAYHSAARSVYEFVDDNDDQDRYPDWSRVNEGMGDPAVFPGWDENNDFIADFNQNSVNIIRPNLKPDWEEPFLRYNVDRPRFLFGMDMNNNGVVDRFENDDQPDYPYKRDRRGYNLYGGFFLGPYARLTLGRLDEWQLADDRRNTMHYALLTYEQDFARLGRLRIYENFRRIEDDIKDNLLIWRIADGIAGQIVPRQDPLPARNAWVNTLYMQFDYRRFERLNFINKFKYEFFKQVDYDAWRASVRVLPSENLRETASFLGLINKVDYTQQVGQLMVQPRWKSEFQRYVPSLKENQFEKPITELRESAFLIAGYPLLSHTLLQVGAEYLWTRQFRDEAKNTLEGSSRTELIGALQLLNRTEYLGYEVFTLMGLRLSRVDIDVLDRVQKETIIFFTLYAGLGT